MNELHTTRYLSSCINEYLGIQKAELQLFLLRCSHKPVLKPDDLIFCNQSGDWRYSSKSCNESRWPKGIFIPLTMRCYVPVALTTWLAHWVVLIKGKKISERYTKRVIFQDSLVKHAFLMHLFVCLKLCVHTGNCKMLKACAFIDLIYNTQCENNVFTTNVFNAMINYSHVKYKTWWTEKRAVTSSLYGTIKKCTVKCTLCILLPPWKKIIKLTVQTKE